MGSSESRYVADHDGSSVYAVWKDPRLCVVVVAPGEDPEKWVAGCSEDGNPVEVILDGSGRFLYAPSGPGPGDGDSDRWAPLGNDVYVFT